MATPLLAVDAPSILFRAFFALPDTIRGRDGDPVNALLGSVNIVLNEIAQHGPRAVVMCFGQDAADYRVQLYDGYHADRPDVPNELDSQFAAAPSLYDALGWHVKSLRGLEADDTLHSLSVAEERAGGSTLLLTGD